MTSAARVGNTTLRFLLELGALTALGVWGWHTGTHPLVRLLLAVGGPGLAAAGWARFVAPRAPRFLGTWGRIGVEVVVFGGAALALVGLGRPRLAVGFAVLAALNTLLVHVWRQDVEARAAAARRTPR